MGDINNDHLIKACNCFWSRIESAIRLFSMIQAGDRVLIHLSGGKSSMALLHCLHEYQNILLQENSDPTNKSIFEIGVVVVALPYENYDLQPLISYLKSLGVTFYYERQGLHSAFLCGILVN
ncbi:hypothetical protein ACTXT7_008273 [Hymenolepis weldensis]